MSPKIFIECRINLISMFSSKQLKTSQWLKQVRTLSHITKYLRVSSPWLLWGLHDGFMDSGSLCPSIPPGGPCSHACQEGPVAPSDVVSTFQARRRERRAKGTRAFQENRAPLRNFSRKCSSDFTYISLARNGSRLCIAARDKCIVFQHL